MGKSLWVALCFLVVVLQCAPSSSAATEDCSTVLVEMSPCLPFVENGSVVSKPGSDCCTGYKNVEKENANCLCEAFKNTKNLPIALNMTKAMSLPSACGVSQPSCGVATSPGASPVPSPKKASPKKAPSPAHSPKSSPKAPATTVSPATPVASPVGNVLAPALSPQHSSARSQMVSTAATAALALVLAAFF